jgi:hypothetical protein
MSALLNRHFSKRSMDMGTSLVCFVFLEEVRIRLSCINAHAIFLNAILGSGKELAYVLLWALSFAQLASSATLLIRSLHIRLGTSVPSIALGVTLLLEFVLYGGYRDWEQTVRVISTLTSLTLLALLRSDTRARSAALDTPLVATALAIEASIRKYCTISHTSVVVTPLFTLLLLRAILCQRYWYFTGSEYELRRASFSTVTSECAVLAFLAGQDKSPSYYIADNVIGMAHKLYQNGRAHLVDRHARRPKRI